MRVVCGHCGPYLKVKVADASPACPEDIFARDRAACSVVAVRSFLRCLGNTRHYASVVSLVCAEESATGRSLLLSSNQQARRVHTT